MGVVQVALQIGVLMLISVAAVATLVVVWQDDHQWDDQHGWNTMGTDLKRDVETCVVRVIQKVRS